MDPAVIAAAALVPQGQAPARVGPCAVSAESAVTNANATARSTARRALSESACGATKRANDGNDGGMARACAAAQSTGAQERRAVALFCDMTIEHGGAFRSDMAYKLRQVEENGFVSTAVRTHSGSFSDVRFGAAARTLLTLPNAGGNSKASEALSLELLSRQLNASLQCTEMELEYFPYGSKITDYSVKVAGQVYGVSVTRAMKFSGLFTREDAEVLLEKKLYGVVASSRAVLKRYRWSKQILHVLVERQYMVDILREVWARMSEELQSNTVVVASVCETAPWVFYNWGFTQEEYEMIESGEMTES